LSFQNVFLCLVELGLIFNSQIISTLFSNCKSTGPGGALLYSAGSKVAIYKSNFSSCTSSSSYAGSISISTNVLVCVWGFYFVL
jgi:hypothetical protein